MALVPTYQFLLVLCINTAANRWDKPSDVQPGIDKYTTQHNNVGTDEELEPSTSTSSPSSHSTIPQLSWTDKVCKYVRSPYDKARTFLSSHYDSSNLRYLQKLPDEYVQNLPVDYQQDLLDIWQRIARSLKRKQASKQMRRGQLQVLVAVYIPITRLCISMLFCRPLPGVESDGRYRWVSTYDTEIGCFDTAHVVAGVFSLGVLAVFTLGFPLWIYVKTVALQDESGARKPSRFSALVRLSYVFKDDHRGWQAAVMLLQVYLTGAKVTGDLFASAKRQTLPVAWFNGASHRPCMRPYWLVSCN